MSDRYQIIGEIGKGGTSYVYRALDTQLKREVALKVIKGDNKESTACLSEALALSALTHPNIVSVHDIGRLADGRQFLVMELIDGETLEGTIHRSVLPTEDLHLVATQVLSGLAAAHSAGYLHRDIKPTNIMLTWPAGGGYLAKILDFGLAKLAFVPEVQTMDQSEGILGSIHYMAPEQFERAPLDARTDLYQLGCTLYFAAAGAAPADGETSAQVMAAHLMSRIEPLAGLRPDIPAPLVDWINTLMARYPGDRPADASAALQSLQALPPLSGGNAHPVAVIPSAGAGLPTSSHSSVPAPVMADRPVIVLPTALPEVRTKRAGTWIAVVAAVVISLVSLALVTARPSEKYEETEPVPRTKQDTAESNPASVPSAGRETEVDPADREAVRALIGQNVRISGTVMSVGESKSGKTRYINTTLSRDDLAIAIDVASLGEEFPMTMLNSLVGRRVHASGRIREVFGIPFLYIEDAAGLEVLH